MLIPRGPLPSGTGNRAVRHRKALTLKTSPHAAACLARRATGISQSTTSTQTASGTLGRKELAPVAKQHRAALQPLVPEYRFQTHIDSKVIKMLAISPAKGDRIKGFASAGVADGSTCLATPCEERGRSRGGVVKGGVVDVRNTLDGRGVRHDVTSSEASLRWASSATRRPDIRCLPGCHDGPVHVRRSRREDHRDVEGRHPISWKRCGRAPAAAASKKARTPVQKDLWPNKHSPVSVTITGDLPRTHVFEPRPEVNESKGKTKEWLWAQAPEYEKLRDCERCLRENDGGGGTRMSRGTSANGTTADTDAQVRDRAGQQEND